MAIDLTRLQHLKGMVAKASNFSEPWTYFFDHFADHLEFIDLGDRVEDELLEVIIDQVGRQIFPGQPRVDNVLLTRLPNERFIHGGFILNGCLGNLIYFEDAQFGMMAVVVSSKETKMMRFSGQRLKSPNQSPSLN